jgi:hypothetical protein
MGDVSQYMANAMATKSEIRAAELRVQVLRAELKDAARLGGAAVRCVRESLAAAEARLRELCPVAAEQMAWEGMRGKLD